MIDPAEQNDADGPVFVQVDLEEELRGEGDNDSESE